MRQTCIGMTQTSFLPVFLSRRFCEIGFAVVCIYAHTHSHTHKISNYLMHHLHTHILMCILGIHILLFEFIMSRLFTMNFGPVSVFTISACLPD